MDRRGLHEDMVEILARALYANDLKNPLTAHEVQMLDVSALKKYNNDTLFRNRVQALTAQLMMRVQARSNCDAGLEQDALRYRWLRNHPSFNSDKIRLEWYLPRHGNGTLAERLDENIDTNMRERSSR